ncbi:hypothetical protein TREAZ_3444 [Leadbettera azotonutricia ZAS-9]|uniref:Uncharacterized protein n=1 Tax=Leadbettera azotonutricia (strain ATCC BAA-888 / DSM 13862 / ZAS-9) TaxID=545695 RepID=F5Y7S4_LEAAZ|nr:hypothetical protein TREAZ_3444 [Leadbettera azotonutricia ZAS-9]
MFLQPGFAISVQSFHKILIFFLTFRGNFMYILYNQILN